MKRSRQEQLQKSQDARREAREKMRETLAKRKKLKTKQAEQTAESNTALPRKTPASDTPIKEFEFECSAKFADERDEVLEYHRAEPLYKHLADELTDLAGSAKVATSLVWPAYPSCVAAIHSLATCAAYERGHKIGLRALLYPAKANSFRELNHIRIDAQWLYSIAQDWQSRLRDGTVGSIASECEHKDILYLSLRHYLDKHGDPAGFPSVGETFPTFPVGRQIWGSFEKKIFNGVFKNVPKRGNPLEQLGNPSSAPDAIFGIHPDLDAGAISHRLTSVELLPDSGRVPDVAIVSLDSRSRASLGSNWATKAARFTYMCLFGLPYSPIGVKVLVDDPIAYLTIRKKLGVQLGRQKRKPHTEGSASFRPIMSLNSSIAPTQGVPQRTISDIRLDAHVVDAEAAAIAAEFNQAARAVQRESDAFASALRECGGYLLWSARLPTGQAALQKMLHDDSGSDQELQWKTETYSWIGVVRRLNEIRSKVAESAGTPNIDHLVQKANDMLASYRSGTPSGVKLHDLVAEIMEATSNSRAKKKKRSRPTITVAVPNALQVRLVHDALERDWQLFDDYGNEVIQVVRTVELFSRNAPTIARRLIALGARAQTIAELCSASDLPKRIDLILSAGDAQRVVQTLDFVLKESVFDNLREPVSELVAQLKEFLESASTQFSLLTNLVYWRPQTHVQASASPSTVSAAEPDYQIQLDDGRTLGLFKSRPVLIYDETRRPPFAQRKGSEVAVGDHLLVISDEMRSDIEVYMDLASRFKNENVVRKYHQHVREKLQRAYPSCNQAQLIERVLSAIQEEFPDAEDITEHKIRYWVTVGREIDQSFDNLRSHAPRSKKDFDRFMHVLNIDEQLADLYWTLGINSLRIDRRHEGRQATLVYQRFLLDSTSVAALLSIPANEESRLLVQARSNVFEVIERKETS